ncbi:hypothetical protein Tco_1305597, partial [Tanacetum coccineum]
GIKPGVPDVPTYKSDDEQISWKSSDEEDDDEVSLNDDDDDNDDDEDNDDDDDDADNQDDDDQENDGQDDEDQDDVNEQTDLDNDGGDFVHPKLSNKDQEIRHNEEESDEEIQGTNVEEEELDEEETNDEDEENELYRDVNVNLEGIDSIFNRNTESTSLIDVSVTTIAEPPLLSTITLPPPPPLSSHICNKHQFLHQQLFQAPPYKIFPILALYSAVSSIPNIIDAYLANKMHEAVKIAVQLQSKRLKDEAQAENADFINKLNDNIKKIIKDQV